jgi:FixJ family two-component response regulator
MSAARASSLRAAPSQSNPPPPTVLVVDDDPSMQQALARLFRSVDLKVEVFGSTRELLAQQLPESAACLVLDVRLPGLSGLDFQTELAKSGIQIPIIFMTGHGDVPMSVKAMKAGATDFLTKPFRDQDMLDAVSHAIEHDRKRREASAEIVGLRTHAARARDHGVRDNRAFEQADCG